MKHQYNEYNDIQVYVKAVWDSWKSNLKEGGKRTLSKEDEQKRWFVFAYGLASEIASLLSELKKFQLQDQGASEYGSGSVVKEELGDILWYLVSVAQIYEFDVHTKICDALLVRTAERFYSSENQARNPPCEDEKKFINLHEQGKLVPTAGTWEGFQDIAKLTRWEKDDTKFFHTSMATMLNAARRILLTRVEPDIRERLNLPDLKDDHGVLLSEKEVVQQALGTIIWHIAVVADALDVQLADIAKSNAKKAHDRYREGPNPTLLFDRKYPPHEQFDRKIDIVFVQKGNEQARMYWKNIRLGDDLTDNAHIEDGYKFHDALHLALVAHLGWSPVMRSLMKRKRKSNKKTDEVEDGARAGIVDEAVVKIIHEHGQRMARERGNTEAETPLYETAQDVSFSLLKMIGNLVRGFEVEECAYWEWEKAILDGYEVYNELNKNRQGTVTLDLEARTITYDERIHLDLDGPVIDTGAASVPNSYQTKSENFTQKEQDALPKTGRETAEREHMAIKLAMQSMLGKTVTLQDIEVLRQGDERRVYVNGAGRDAARERNMLGYKVSLSETGGYITAHITAVGDPGKTW